MPSVTRRGTRRATSTKVHGLPGKRSAKTSENRKVKKSSAGKKLATSDVERTSAPTSSKPQLETSERGKIVPTFCSRKRRSAEQTSECPPAILLETVNQQHQDNENASHEPPKKSAVKSKFSIRLCRQRKSVLSESERSSSEGVSLLDLRSLRWLVAFCLSLSLADSFFNRHETQSDHVDPLRDPKTRCSVNFLPRIFL